MRASRGGADHVEVGVYVGDGVRGAIESVGEVVEILVAGRHVST
jgi:hypothetical protein